MHSYGRRCVVSFTTLRRHPSPSNSRLGGPQNVKTGKATCFMSIVLEIVLYRCLNGIRCCGVFYRLLFECCYPMSITLIKALTERLIAFS
jgi:hypothetical protein